MEKVIEKTEKIEELDRITVSSGLMGKLLGVSDSRIRQLAREGILIRASKGRYLLYDSIKNYIRTLKIQKDIEIGDEDTELVLEEEKAKHEKVKRLQSVLKLALMQGEVHKGTDVEAVMNDMLTNVKSKLLGLPAKISPRLVGQDEIGYIKEVLTVEVRETLNELRVYNPSDFYSEEFIDIDDHIKAELDGMETEGIEYYDQ